MIVLAILGLILAGVMQLSRARRIPEKAAAKTSPRTAAEPKSERRCETIAGEVGQAIELPRAGRRGANQDGDKEIDEAGRLGGLVIRYPGREDPANSAMCAIQSGSRMTGNGSGPAIGRTRGIAPGADAAAH